MSFTSHLWIFWGALLSSKAVNHWNERCTDVDINASVKSQVLLPCHYDKNLYNDTVIWSHLNKGDTLLRITKNGLIFFDRPRGGRVSVLPNLFKEGNFSILIHDLESSDVGMYICELSSECWRVKVTELAKKTEELSSNKNSWLFFFAGAGLFSLLFIVFNRTGLHNCLLSWTDNCTSRCRSDNEEHQENNPSSPPSFNNKDSKDPTTSTVYYVIQG